MTGEVSMTDVLTIIGVVIGSGLIQFLITRHDNRKGMEKQIGELKQQQDETKKELLGKIDSIEEKFDKRMEETDKKSAKREAEECRTNILRFSDDLKNEIYHSEEYFIQILDDIDTYNKYCERDKDFKNGRTVTATKHIKAVYENTFFDKVAND